MSRLVVSYSPEGHRSDECITIAAIIFHLPRPWPGQDDHKDAGEEVSQ